MIQSLSVVSETQAILLGGSFSYPMIISSNPCFGATSMCNCTRLLFYALASMIDLLPYTRRYVLIRFQCGHDVSQSTKSLSHWSIKSSNLPAFQSLRFSREMCWAKMTASCSFSPSPVALKRRRYTFAVQEKQIVIRKNTPILR